jgi:hypothetical protein
MGCCHSHRRNRSAAERVGRVKPGQQSQPNRSCDGSAGTAACPVSVNRYGKTAPLRRGCGKLLSLRLTRLVGEISPADAEGWGEAARRGVDGNRRRKSLYRTRITLGIALWPGVVIFNPCRTDGYGLR